MKRVLIQQISSEQKTSKGGKPYTAVGIKIDGQFYNGLGTKETDSWKTGDTVTLELYEEEYNGKMYKKFRVPSQVDLLTAVVKGLEARIAKLEEQITPVKPEAEQPEVPPSTQLENLPF